jgi:hypothetical protein
MMKRDELTRAEVRPPVDDEVFDTVMLPVVADAFIFPNASANEPEATVTTAVPPLVGDAVNVAVYVVPLPEKLLRVPRVTETSDALNVVVDSLDEKVIVDVPPDASVEGFGLTVITGGVVS